MIRYKIFLLTLTAFVALSASAQTDATASAEGRFAAVLNSVADRNTTLRAASASLSATELQNRAASALADPEAEVTYAKGSPKGVPARTNVSFTQTLDWGTLTGRRTAAASASNRSAAARYAVERKEVMAEADELLVRLVYDNKRCAELAQRLQTAEALQALFAKRLERGDANQMEINKVQLNTAVARAEVQRAEAERRATLQSLSRLAGGEAVAFSDTVYPHTFAALPPLSSLHSALASSAETKVAEAEIVENEAMVRLARSQTWPALTVGFQGEYVKDNNYNGLSLGLSVPLWGGTRRELKVAQSRIVASQLEAADVKLQQSALLAERYRTASALSESADSLASNLRAASNGTLLRHALEEGQISLLDYLLESSFYYGARTAQLEAERDAQLALSALRGMFY